MATPVRVPDTPDPAQPPAPDRQGNVTISVDEYRRLCAERDQAAQIKAAHDELAKRYATLLDTYKNLHHSYYELVKTELDVDNWEKESFDMNGAAPFESVVEELERGHAGD
jgi:hypothetical protein